MYIRKTAQLDKKTNQYYSTHRLVESYRNAQGSPRQQTLLNLGTHFAVPESQWKTLADRIEEILKGQAALLLEGSDALEMEAQRIANMIVTKGTVVSEEPQERRSLVIPSPEDYQCVDINSLTHQDVRFVGAEAVGVQVASQLGLPGILARCGLNGKQVEVALGTIIARLVSPGSELATHRYLTQHSALDELLDCSYAKLPLHSLYSIGDLLLKHKEAIEASLYQREVNLFNLDEMVTLYDLTNTYFEGQALLNEKAKYGRSKEKRSDCCLVALGMVLDGSGFPRKSKIYEGNISEPSTFKAMLEELKGSLEKPTVVMDAGIATEANLSWLKEHGFHYIVVSRKQKKVACIPDDAEPLILKSSPSNTVTGYLVKSDDEVELYCHSEAKEAKSQKLKSKFEQRLEMGLTKLSVGLANVRGSSRQYAKVMERIGRLKQRYSKTAKYYDIEVSLSEDKSEVTAISFVQNRDKRHQEVDGIYCLRSNHCDVDGETLWSVYTMLTELEAAFRHLKSELGLRPVYHQIETRVDAHLFISILAYHLLHAIRHQLKAAHIHSSWQEIRTLLKTHIRVTSTLKCQDGHVLHIRKNSLPTVEQRRIYEALDMPTQSLASTRYYRTQGELIKK
jgi:transposase